MLSRPREREAALSGFFLIPKSLSSCDSRQLQFLHLLIQFPEANPSALLPRLLELTSKTIFDLNLAAKALSFVEANPLSAWLPGVTAEVCLQSLLTDPRGREGQLALPASPPFPSPGLCANCDPGCGGPEVRQEHPRGFREDLGQPRKRERSRPEGGPACAGAESV